MRDFDAEARFGFKEARRIDRAAQLGVAAAGDAVLAAFGEGGPAAAGCDPGRVGVVAGTGIGGLRTSRTRSPCTTTAVRAGSARCWCR